MFLPSVLLKYTSVTIPELSESYNSLNILLPLWTEIFPNEILGVIDMF